MVSKTGPLQFSRRQPQGNKISKEPTLSPPYTVHELGILFSVDSETAKEAAYSTAI